MQNITAVELEPWEIERFKAQFPDGNFLTTHLAEAENIGEPEVLAIFINSPINAEALHRLPKLKFITTMSTGFDHIDLAACKQRGITVSNVPSYGENTVAEHALALLLALSRQIVPSVERTRQSDFTLNNLRGVDLANKTMGVIGTGRIGQRFIAMAKGLAMRVLAYEPRPKPAVATELGFSYVSLEELLMQADAVSLHAPATPETYHLLNEERLRLMKAKAFLINTARGSLIDTQALVKVLESGHLAGVGLDVLEEEAAMKKGGTTPHEQSNITNIQANHVLLGHSKVLVTPHNAFNSQEAVERILATTIENIQAWQAGQPKNIISARL